MSDKNFNNICLIIPAYQPDELLVKLVDELRQTNYANIVVINDGSDKSKQLIFDRIKEYPATTVITHAKNMGKGEALKTGLNWVIKNYPTNIVGVVTVDADGQHLPKDVEKIATTLIAQPQAYILGVRAFDTKVPWRSRFGNSLTRTLLELLYKTRIQDTQTGLRGIPFSLMQEFIKISAGRYEYEMVCVLEAVKSAVPIEQIPVDTVYINHNNSSHFNPFIDSIRIYYVFLRFALQK